MGLFFIALAVVTWNFLTPDLDRMATLEPGWVALIWLRNAALLTLVAGGLHWWLYIRQGQGREFKYNVQWLSTNSRKFLWRNQVKDNMFWSLVSGCTLWSMYESVTLWLYASGHVHMVEWDEAPIYLALMTVFVFFWSTFHFYLNHRLLHWQSLFRAAHELHHRYFHVNFGNTPTPMDKLFGSWHDGTPDAHAAFRDLLRARRTGARQG